MEIVDITKLKNEIDEAFTAAKVSDKEKEAAELEEQMQEADFWKNQEDAKRISTRASNLRKSIDKWQKIRGEVDELNELRELGDSSLEKELTQKITEINANFDQLRLELYFSGQYDDHNVVMRIQSGVGGLDAEDWANMLMRMYQRWAQQNSFDAKLVQQSLGEEGGIKSATMLVGGEYAYGKLKGEHGVHRLVRKSPFNSAASRETSFARVEVLPEISSDSEVEIDERDLRVDVYRSSGKGGQSVNTTDSAVRITHLPTNIVVSIQNERSQIQNKETALKILKSKLLQLSLEQHSAKLDALKGENKEAAWGNQIRNYVLHPYQLVKDTKSNFETKDVDKVLDGDLNPIIEAALKAG